MTTATSPPTIGRNIGDDVPPVSRSALRETGDGAKLRKIQTALLGSIDPVSTIHVFGGVFAGGSFGSVVQFWDADYTDNFMIGGIYGRDFKDLGAGFVLGGVAGAAIRFGDDDDTTGELWAGLRIRHHGLVIGDLAIAPGFTAGLSVVTGATEIERAREIHYDGDASFLGFLGPEVAFKFRQAPHVEFVYQLHHRSGADGVFGDLGEGSNASTFGLRYRF